MRRLVRRARAVLVVPQFLKISYVVGGAGGSGVLIVKDSKTGRFSPPAFYTLGAGGIGFQLGASASEVVLLILTERGLDAVLKDKFKLGVEVSAAIGPVGAGGEAATTSNLDADIVSFARSKGFFLGLSFEGAVMHPRALWNEAYYGKKVSPSDILLKQAVQKPAAAPLAEAVRKVAALTP
jgi:lipid-binding SYLF domain-containing protein